LKSRRCIFDPIIGERHARTALPTRDLNEALTPASFGCAQIDVCDGEQMQ
jgi:hypothetical protein